MGDQGGNPAGTGPSAVSLFFGCAPHTRKTPGVQPASRAAGRTGRAAAMCSSWKTGPVRPGGRLDCWRHLPAAPSLSCPAGPGSTAGRATPGCGHSRGMKHVVRASGAKGGSARTGSRRCATTADLTVGLRGQRGGEPGAVGLRHKHGVRNRVLQVRRSRCRAPAAPPTVRRPTTPQQHHTRRK